LTNSSGRLAACGEKVDLIVLAIKNDLVRLFADLAKMNKTFYFAKYSYFGAIGRLSGADHFFSPAQYIVAWQGSSLRTHLARHFVERLNIRNCIPLPHNAQRENLLEKCRFYGVVQYNFDTIAISWVI
jgi:hypothetical protein